MAQTFDIRFARSAGFAALLEAPVNRHRWKGRGRLSIDAKGISIGVKRSFAALLGAKHTQHISIESLRSVYREGEALRVEYETEKSRRDVLPFWVDDRDTAAQIVKLLPTHETVELERSPDAALARKARPDWRMFLVAVIALLAIAMTAWALYLRTASLPVAAAKPAEEVDSAIPTPVTDSLASDAAPVPDVTYAALAFDVIPRVTTSSVVVLPIARGTRNREIAVDELALFEREAAALEYDYREAYQQVRDWKITPADFANKLEELEVGWWKITSRIHDNRQLEDLELAGFRGAMLGAARGWRDFLGEYASALRTGDLIRVTSLLSDVAGAQELRARARDYVR